MNKKGEMTIGTIVSIALAVVVLIFLVFGFSTGWGNLWNKITNWNGNKVNVDTIKISCEMACKNENKYDYCIRTKKVITSDKVIEDNCNSLVNRGLIKVSCSNIECSEEYYNSVCDSMGGIWVVNSCEGRDDISPLIINSDKVCCKTNV